MQNFNLSNMIKYFVTIILLGLLIPCFGQTKSFNICDVQYEIISIVDTSSGPCFINTSCKISNKSKKIVWIPLGYDSYIFRSQLVIGLGYMCSQFGGLSPEIQLQFKKLLPGDTIAIRTKCLLLDKKALLEKLETFLCIDFIVGKGTQSFALINDKNFYEKNMVYVQTNSYCF